MAQASPSHVPPTRIVEGAELYKVEMAELLGKKH
jgi:hypothetical protein